MSGVENDGREYVLGGKKNDWREYVLGVKNDGRENMFGRDFVRDSLGTVH